MKIFFIACGYRNTFDNEKLNLLLESSSSIETFLHHLQLIADKDELSNSEIGLVLASYGAYIERFEIEYVRLNYFYNEHETNISFLIEKLAAEANGVIFGSPLHFGNPSSYFLQFLSQLNQYKIFPLLGKMVGCTTVGARRNGGQEYGNIFSLFECA